MRDITSEELNEQVAVEVMGWRFDEDWGCLVPPEQKAKPSEMWTDWTHVINDEHGLLYCGGQPIDENHVPGVVYTHGHKKIRLPDFSGDMGEAWKAVRRLHTLGFVLALYQAVPSDEWNATFFVMAPFRKKPGREGYWARGKDVACTVCHAALEAVRAGVSQSVLGKKEG